MEHVRSAPEVSALPDIDAFEHSAIGMVVTDPGGRFRRVNPAFAALVGRSPSDLVGMTFMSLTSPDDRPVSQTVMSDLLAGRVEVARFEKRYLRPDGSPVWADMTCRAMRDVDGVVVALLTQALDVSERKRAEEALRRQALVFEVMADAVFVSDQQGRVLDCNPAAERLSGLSRRAILAGALAAGGDLFPRREREVRAALAAGGSWTGDVTFQGGGADPRVAEAVVIALHDLDGNLAGAVAVCHDVTASRADSLAIADAEERFRLAFDNAPIGMIMRSLSGSDIGRVLRVNPAVCRMLGYTAEELLTRTLPEITHPDDCARDHETLSGLGASEVHEASYEKRYLHRDGHVVWAALHIAAVRDHHGKPLYALTQIEDITAQRAEVEELTERAFHDPLTGLANRSLLVDRLDHALVRIRRQNTSLALLFIDLDEFKEVNDTWGHRAGDERLVDTARVLTELVRPADTVARVGGDEFVVLCEDLHGGKSAERLARRVTAALEPYGSGASVGLVVSSGAATSSDLLHRADQAMYRVKRARRAARDDGVA